MENTRQSDEEIIDQVAERVARIDLGMMAEDSEEQQQWLQSDERRARIFARQRKLKALIEHLPTDYRVKLIASVQGRRDSPSRVLRWLASAAAILVVLVGAWFIFEHPEIIPRSYANPTTGVRVVPVAEGSTITLDARSQVRWDGGLRDRRAELIRGRALFAVAPNRQRPFIVAIGTSEVRVVGTRFEIYLKPSGEIVLTVLEGVVEARGSASSAGGEWTRKIDADHQLVYGPQGVIWDTHEAAGSSAIRWLHGDVEFAADTPLRDVVSELNRYSDRPIVIADRRLEDMTVGGQFQVHDIHKVLAAIAHLVPVSIREDTHQITLQYRSEVDERRH
jgi:transmembrane sensor